MANDVNLNIVADISKASKSVERFSNNAKTSLQNVEKGFAALKVVAGAAVAVFAGRQIASGINQIVEAASIQEDAINDLNTSLKLAGQFSEETSKRLQNFASSVQDQTTIGDEAVLQLTALAQSYVSTSEDAESLTKAAIDFATGAGISTTEAVRRLGRAVQGSAGDVANFVPEIRGLTKEQLASGEATRLISERFEGAAAALKNTFSGAVTSAKNAQGDLLEELGFLITQNPVFVEAIKAAEKGFVALIEIINENRDGIIDFVNNAISTFLSVSSGLLTVLSAITDHFANALQISTLAARAILILVDTLLQLEPVQVVIDALKDGFILLGKAVLTPVKGLLELAKALPSGILEDFGINIEAVESAVNSFDDTLDDSFGKDIAKDAAESFSRFRTAATDAIDATADGARSVADSIDNIAGFASDASKSVLTLGKDQVRSANEAGKSLKKFGGLSKEAYEELVTAAKEAKKAEEERAKAVKTAAQAALAATKNFGKTQTEILQEAAKEQIAAISAGYTEGVVSQQTAADAILRINQKLAGDLKNLEGESTTDKKTELNNQTADVQSAANEQVSIFDGAFKEIGSLASGAGDLILGGLSSAGDFITDTFSTLFDDSIKSSEDAAAATEAAFAKGSEDRAKAIEDNSTAQLEAEDEYQETLKSHEKVLRDLAVLNEDISRFGLSNERSAEFGELDSQRIALEKLGIQQQENLADLEREQAKLNKKQEAAIKKRGKLEETNVTDIETVRRAALAETAEVQKGFLAEEVTTFQAAFLTAGQQLPGILSGGVAAFQEALPGIIESFKSIMPDIIAQVPKLIGAIVDAVPQIIEALGSQIPNIIDALSDVFQKVLEKLPEIIDGLTELVPTIVAKLAEAAVGFINAIVENFPAILDSVINMAVTFVGAILENLPQVITSLAESIGPIIETLGEKLPELITGLLLAITDNIGPIIKTLIEAIPDIIAATPTFISAFTKGMIAAAPELLKAFFLDFPQNLRDGVIEGVKGLASEIGDAIADGASSVGGFFGGVGETLGFADGGTVPAGFPNDTFPARLSSGEEVVDRTTSQQLRDFLDDQGNEGSTSQPLTVNLQIGQDQLANVMLDLNRQGFRTA